MATIVGKRKTAKTSQAGAGKVPARTPQRRDFFWMVSLKGWNYSPSVGHWLPRLKPHYLEPGTNGITAGSDPTNAYNERQRNGFTVIKPDDPRLGEFMHYVKELPYSGAGSFCVSIFDDVEVAPDGEVWITRDAEAFDAFRVFLVESGIVPPLDDRRKRTIMQQKLKTLQRKESVAADALEGSAAHRRLAEYRDDYNAALKAGPPPPPGAPKPKPRRTRRKAAPKPSGGDA